MYKSIVERFFDKSTTPTSLHIDNLLEREAVCRLIKYVFFEKDSFTVTITIGKSELKRLYQELDNMLPKTKELWENRYPCGDGGWVHYHIVNDNELLDVEKLICIKKNQNKNNIYNFNLY